MHTIGTLVLTLLTFACWAPSLSAQGAMQESMPNFEDGVWQADHYLPEGVELSEKTRIGGKVVSVPWIISRLYWRTQDPEIQKPLGMFSDKLGMEFVLLWDKSVPVARIWNVSKPGTATVFYFAVRTAEGWTQPFSTADRDMRSLIDINKKGEMLGFILEVHDTKKAGSSLFSKYFRNPTVRHERPFRRIQSAN